MDFPQQFGKYTLLRRLATGGMAEIFLARQVGVSGFEKEVVVKRLLPENAANQEFVSMFLDEARIAAHLTHPNIAQIFDLGQEGEDYYIAMEYVRGADLRRVCSQGIAEGNYLPLHHAVRIVAEVCDALTYAHGRTSKDGRPLNIVHRDVSPTNILVTYDGGVKLVDFGIAKAENKVSVTKTGQIKGKYGYMSPEQCRGDHLDARSDIFAVGINLYELTLGRRLFRGDSDVETLRAIESGAIPAPRSISPDYPARLEAIVLRALARDANDRYTHARDLQVALEDFLAESSLRATAGMLGEYMRQLFRDQLDLEGRDGSGVRPLPQLVQTPAPQLRPAVVDDHDPLDETMGDAAPDMPAPGRPSVDVTDAPSDSFEVLTSALPLDDAPTARVDLKTLADDTLVDGRKMQITRLAEDQRRPAAPPGPAPGLSAEPSIDDLMVLPTPSIELILEPSGISGPLGEMAPGVGRVADETPLVPLASMAKSALRPQPPQMPAPEAQSGGSGAVAAGARPAPRPAQGQPVVGPPPARSFSMPVLEVDESEIQVRAPRRYTTALLFLLLVVTLLFGIQYLFVEGGERVHSRRTPARIAETLPPGLTILGSQSPDAPAEAPSSPPRLGIVRIESDPPGARVVVNGNMLNSMTPASVQTLADRKSTIRILQAGYLPWEKRVDVDAAGTEVKAVLDKGKPELGKLLVESSPPGAKVSINGAEAGTTPVTLEKVGAGTELTMRLERAGFHPHGVLFTLQKDEERAIGVNLIADTGPRAAAVINVESIPLGATVFDANVEDGKRPLGKTGNYPLKLNRPVDGGLRLRAELAGFGAVERDLDVKLPYYTVYLRFAESEKIFGTLSIAGAPKIMVYLGNQELGETPLRKVKVPAGEQVLVLLDAASGKRIEYTLKVEKGAHLEKKVALVEGSPALQ